MSRVLAFVVVLLAVAACGADKPAGDPDQFSLLAPAAREPGVERVVMSPGGPITAAVRTVDVLVTADAALRVWDPATGAVLGEHALARPLTALAASDQVSSVAASDEDGSLALWDVGDPARPVVHPLDEETGAPLVHLTFNGDGTELMAVRADGRVDRFESSSGAPLSSLRLGSPITAAALVGERLYAATPAREVVAFDLATLERTTLVDAARMPGDVTALTASEYGPTVIGTTGGLVHDDDGKITVEPGRAITGVASSEFAVWEAGADGVSSSETGVGSRRDTAALVTGPGGPVALNRDGSVSLLAERVPDLELANGPWASAAAFGPAGDLLTTDGEDLVGIEALVRVQPGVAGEDEDGSAVAHRLLRRYEPDPSWWEDEAEGTWSVDQVALGHERAVAAGKDPAGAAVLLVWDAATGRPLRRLALPAAVGSVAILEHAGLLAASSGERLMLWSLSDLEAVATIATGTFGRLAVTPDERTIVVAGTRLAFVDVGRRAVDHAVDLAAVAPTGALFLPDGTAVATPGAAFSPDGRLLAVLGAGDVRFLGADGREQEREPVALGAAPLALAWRPDGSALAIALNDRRTVLVEPEGRVSAGLRPPWTKDMPVGLSWRADGQVLAVTNRARREDVDYEDGSDEHGPMMRPFSLFRFDRLAAHACALGAAACPAPEPPPPAAAAGPATVAYVGVDGSYATDAAGHTFRLERRPVDAAHLERDPQFVWSGSGALLWTGHGAVHRLAPGASTPESWPCACDGVALDGETPVAVTRDATSLLRFGASTQRVALTGLPPEGVWTIGHAGGATIVSGYRGEQERDSPNPISAVADDGVVTPLDPDPPGHFYGTATRTPDGRALAFAVVASGGACYSSATVGVFEDGRLTFRRPPGLVPSVRSLRYDAQGGLYAVSDAQACEPDPKEYRLDGATWVPTNGDTAWSSAGGRSRSERPRSP